MRDSLLITGFERWFIGYWVDYVGRSIGRSRERNFHLSHESRLRGRGCGNMDPREGVLSLSIFIFVFLYLHAYLNSVILHHFFVL